MITHTFSDSYRTGITFEIPWKFHLMFYFQYRSYMTERFYPALNIWLNQHHLSIHPRHN